MPEMTSDIIIKDLVSMLGIKAVLHHDDDTAHFCQTGIAAIMAKHMLLHCQKRRSGLGAACLCR